MADSASEKHLFDRHPFILSARRIHFSAFTRIRWLVNDRFPAVLVLGLAATVSSCGIRKCKEMPYSLGSGEDNEIMPLTRYLVILSLFVATTPSLSNPASQSLPNFLVLRLLGKESR